MVLLRSSKEQDKKTYQGEKKMKNEMRLQGIGMVEGTEAGKIQVGDILRWNHGGLSKVISFEFSKTGKTINCQVEVINSRTGEKEIYERSMRITRLVNIVASANTNNDFNLQFDPIKEEAPEAEEKASSDIEKIKFYDLQEIEDWKEAVVVFTKDSFEKEFTELERSYQISSDAKYFDANMGGSSLFGDCLDGKDLGVRLDIYIYDGWKVDYAYITEYKKG